jgi:hypothetical protein
MMLLARTIFLKISTELSSIAILDTIGCNWDDSSSLRSFSFRSVGQGDPPLLTVPSQIFALEGSCPLDYFHWILNSCRFELGPYVLLSGWIGYMYSNFC